MIEFYEAWLLKAQNDLNTAEILIGQDCPITDTAIYHTQQCAEKALKGFLAYHRSEIPKVHNLAALVIQCSSFDPAFRILLSEANNLTPKAAEFRYLDNFEEVDDVSQLFPTAEEVETAIAQAKRILDFVKSKIAKK